MNIHALVLARGPGDLWQVGCRVENFLITEIAEPKESGSVLWWWFQVYSHGCLIAQINPANVSCVIYKPEPQTKENHNEP